MHTRAIMTVEHEFMVGKKLMTTEEMIQAGAQCLWINTDAPVYCPPGVPQPARHFRWIWWHRRDMELKLKRAGFRKIRAWPWPWPCPWPPCGGQFWIRG